VISLQRLTSDMLELLQIASPTFGESAASRWLAQQLAAFGVTAEDDGASERIGGSCGNLIARIPGSDATAPLLLNAHMDNVPPCEGVRPIVEDNVIRSDGRTVLGADDKVGCVAILTAVRSIVESDLPRPPLEVVFTAAEEVGLEGAKALDYSSLAARRGFVMESGSLGSITVAAPSADRWEAVVGGKAAHAGVAPEEGINAIRIAAEAVAAMRLGRLDDETTANVGLIGGGQARNVVPPECRLSGEARSHNEGKLKAQIDHVRQCFDDAATRHGGRAKLRVKRSYDAFRIEPGAWPLRIAERAAIDVGIIPNPRPTGGGSDANVFNANGIACVVMSAGAHEVHTTNEFMDIRDLHHATRWLIRAIKLAAEEP
jgi:tripeptide aminopeptidase